MQRKPHKPSFVSETKKTIKDLISEGQPAEKAQSRWLPDPELSMENSFSVGMGGRRAEGCVYHTDIN